MNSARPPNKHTVPLRPGGGAQRANRSETPSEVFIAPVTTFSGTGLAGIEMSFIGVATRPRREPMPYSSPVGACSAQVARETPRYGSSSEIPRFNCLLIIHRPAQAIEIPTLAKSRTGSHILVVQAQPGCTNPGPAFVRTIACRSRRICHAHV